LDWLRTTAPPPGAQVTPLSAGSAPESPPGRLRLGGRGAQSGACYPGQETVARVLNTGRPPRRLVFLHLDGSEAHLPEAGEPIRLADSGADAPPIGHVTSVATHYELGPVALGLVKRSTPADAGLEVGPGAAGVAVAAAATAVVPPSGESDSRPPSLAALRARTRAGSGGAGSAGAAPEAGRGPGG
jgi:hypothetical protein